MDNLGRVPGLLQYLSQTWKDCSVKVPPFWKSFFGGGIHKHSAMELASQHMDGHFQFWSNQRVEHVHTPNPSF